MNEVALPRALAQGGCNKDKYNTTAVITLQRTICKLRVGSNYQTTKVKLEETSRCQRH